MARKTFFSFHYKPDVQRAQVVRKSQFFKDHGEAGFYDASAFEKTKNEDPERLKRFLRKEIQGTSVICVLIGAETASRRWVRFEILQALFDGRGLMGVRIHSIANFEGTTAKAGDNPFDLLGVYCKDDEIQVVERKTISDKWTYTSDFGKQLLDDWPYTSKLPPTGCTALSKFFSIYSWANDSHERIEGWIETAATQAGY
ncbi:TIR domain-containing protein [Hydrogenophaga luteola]|uniref:TIR domain-containing protein n=1 Tax=Hydrogenophaga luteola TaxID=1591122 RepID=A0ABV7VZN8_9BURK